MAHTALYGGTVYEKKGGADLVGGTVYKKDHGKVLVGGTEYEVGFGLNLEVPEGMYLTFSSANPFTIAVNNTTKNWDGALYYSTDAAEWSEWDGTTAIASATDNGEQRLYMCGAGNSVIAGSSSNKKWVIKGNNITCSGNIECLLDYEIVANGGHPAMANYCYASMFSGCTGLTTAPSLPATTLADYCYNAMFRGCTSLTTAPNLPAATLVKSCYASMFSGCTGLTSVPSLPATTLATGCCNSMFYGCTSLTTAPSLPATTLATTCYNAMFRGCTSLTTAPSLPATTLADYCYGNIFYGCTGLTSVPSLPATTLATGCYNSMFRNCTKIKLSSAATETYTLAYRIPYSGTGTTVSDALYNMFSSTGGTFTGTPEINTTYYLDSSNTIV